MKNLAIKLKRKFSQNERLPGSGVGSRPATHSLSRSSLSGDAAPSSTTTASSSTATAAASTGGSTAKKHSRSNSHIEPTEEIQKHKQYRKEDLLEQVPSFREVSPDKRKALLVRKLRLCAVVFDFHSESASETVGKEMKRQLLLELVDHVTTNKGWFSERVLPDILQMVSWNLFRALAPSTALSPGGFDPDEDEPALDAAWPHLQIVYEFLLRFIVSTEPDPKLLKKHLGGDFILSLLAVFRSEDPREREYLKTILHRIYGKFMSLRSFIRKSINNVFYAVIYENERHHGIGELLEILGSIINGFALPLKAEHKRFLQNVLIPLHKVGRLQAFHQQLSYCVTQFIEKDNGLALPIMGGLIRYWPLVSSSKEVLLLNELEEVIEITPAPLLQLFVEPVFKRLARCIQNQHFQVAERALFFWNNDLIGSLTADFKAQIFPLIVPALHKIKQLHWNSTVHSLSLNVTKMLIEIDSELYSAVATAPETRDRDESERTRKWERIRQIADGAVEAGERRKCS